jgi:hypothetical protein
MYLGEALKISKKAKRFSSEKNGKKFYHNFTLDTFDVWDYPAEEILADDWEPVKEKRKIVLDINGLDRFNWKIINESTAKITIEWEE